MKIAPATPIYISKLKWTWHAHFLSYAPVILGNKVSFKGPQMILLAIFYFLNGIEIKNFACLCPVHSRVVPA